MYSKFINHIIMPLSDRVLGLTLNKELHNWRKIQWFSQDQLQTLQCQNLKQLLGHLIHIPYYNQIIQKNKLDLNKNPFAILAEFPFLTKDIIRKNLDGGIVDASRRIYSKEMTSGSSGHQCTFYMDNPAYSMTYAIQSLWWEWSGYQLGDKTIQTGMTLDRSFPKKVKDYFLRVKYTQAFNMDPDIVRQNLNQIRGSKDYYFMGYASSLYTYAQISKEAGIHDIQFKAIISWGDKMFPHYRALLENMFHSTVFDTYGASEGTMIAAECNHHNYHIMSPHVHVEIVDENGKEVKPGEWGEVIVTRLDNYLMPLVRYKIGDLAVKKTPDTKCTCGRELPLLERIIGRDTDIVKMKSGKNLIVHFFTGIFEFQSEIKQFQVVQYSLNDIEIRYVPARNFRPNVLKKIEKSMFEKADQKFPVRFSKVNKIEPTQSGKPQIIISKLDE